MKQDPQNSNSPNPYTSGNLSFQKLNPRFMILLLLIGLSAIFRIFTTLNSDQLPFANFTPIGAMALFGGAYFTRFKSYLFPILTLWLSDLIITRAYMGEWQLFYQGFYWTYGAFALMVLVGQRLLTKVTAMRYFTSSLLIVFIHWVVTDLGVWLGGTLYPMTWSGYWACMVAAIPFELNLLAGTLIYGAAMFGLFEFMQKKYPTLKTSQSASSVNLEGQM